MAFRKRRERERLRLADNEISAESGISSVNNNLLEKYTMARGNVSSVFSKKTKFPIALDIIISILLVLLVVAIVAGACFIVARFNDAHDSRNIEYQLLIERSEIDDITKGENLYVDKDGSAIYFGRVVDVNDRVVVTGKEQNADYVIVTLHATVQYRDDEGYSIGSERIAVGREISARIDSDTFKCEIISLVILRDQEN